MTTASEKSYAATDHETAGLRAITRTLDGMQFLAFLHDRLNEEILAATYRRQTGTGPDPEVAERGLRLLDELVLDIKTGRGIDPVSLKLLTLAYRDHPDFRPSWESALPTWEAPQQSPE